MLGVTAFTAATIYLMTYIPFFALGNSFSDLVALQQQMFWYHSSGVANATHPYSSVWWQWPIEQIPISYYYKDFRAGVDAANGAACCVAEILALPNPAVFLLGLVSVPFTAWLAWRERNKGYALLALAYVFQWLPYARSPRILWEYHFFPNLAVIVLCDVVLIALRRAAARGEHAALVAGRVRRGRRRLVRVLLSGAGRDAGDVRRNGTSACGRTGWTSPARAGSSLTANQ